MDILNIDFDSRRIHRSCYWLAHTHAHARARARTHTHTHTHTHKRGKSDGAASM